MDSRKTCWVGVGGIVTIRSVMLAVALGSLAQGGAFAQAAVEKIASISHEMGYSAGAWSYIDGALYGADRASTKYPPDPLRMIRFDLATGALTEVASPNPNATSQPFL